ncbi:MAG: EAL domain-containing protein [Spirochaetales bacterium]
MERIDTYIADLSSDCIVMVDADYRYTLANKAYIETMNVTRDKIVGSTIAETWGEDVFEPSIKPAIDSAFSGKHIDRTERYTVDGEERVFYVRYYPSSGGQSVDHVLIFANEITPGSGDSGERRGEHDRITGLFNRQMMDVLIPKQLAQAARSEHETLQALLFISLRNFKQINRTYGHAIGDILLENSALRVNECLRSGDFVFRFDGTNFVVLLTHIKRDTDASIVARKIRDSVTVPYRMDNVDFRIECYIGIALYPQDTTDAHQLIQAANSASIDAEQTADTFCFYDRETHNRAVERIQLHTQLQRAFEADEFQMYYQPVSDISGNPPKIVGVEALLRWKHPDRGLLSPGSFLSLAEETKVVLAIDRWALFTVCETLARLQSYEKLIVTVNVSSATFMDDHFIDIIEGALRAAGNPDPTLLRIELTESMSVENLDMLHPRFRELERLGIRLWIDDFGVGQSSLSMLKALPAHGIKIDRSFVQGSEHSEKERKYLEGIVESVRAREKDVIVEGISNEHQLSVARSLHCTYAQGFFIAQPMELEALDAFLVRKGFHDKEA